MGEHERESPATTSGHSPVFYSHQGDQLGQVVPTGGIWAETITATNVANVQNIAEQHIHLSRQKYAPPLYRPRRAEHFQDRVSERAWLLAYLHPGRIVTICGPGGMGKTALVAEVLWTLAPGDTPPASFPDGLVFHSFYGQPKAAVALEQLARTFGEDPLPKPAQAAQRALSGKHVLLVLDGAEEADHLEQVLAVCGQSAVLLTSRRRADAPDPVYRLDLQPLPEQEAVSVVQAFGGEHAVDVTATSRICACVGNLPLALRLVGRYLAEQEEEAGEYLDWLEQTPLSALNQGASCEKSVSILLERSTQQVSATAQQVLRLLGFLALAAFDRALIAQFLDVSEDVARRALGELVNYGLLVRQQTGYEVSHVLIHTYAREALVAQTDSALQKSLLERIVRVLDERFPKVEYASWERCEALLPHVQTCATYLTQHQLTLPEAAYLLTRAGWYLREQAQWTQAAFLLQQALTIAEHTLGSNHTSLSVVLNNLAQLYRAQGRYQEAEPLYQRALAIYERAFGLDHPDTAITLGNLAQLYQVQGRYQEAEPLYQQALAVKERMLPPDHPSTAITVGNLAGLYRVQGRFQEAEPLYQRALVICEQALPPDHPDTAITLDNLAQLYRAQGRYQEAEPLYQRALAIKERAFGPDHPSTAITVGNLAGLYRVQGRFQEAEPLLKRSLTIKERVCGPDHPETAITLDNLAQFYQAQKRYQEAEPLYQRALAICERALPPDHPDTAITLDNLAQFYQAQGRYQEAEPLYQRALAIKERALPPDHPSVATTLESYASLLQAMQRSNEAIPLVRRARSIRAKQLLSSEEEEHA